VINKLRTVSRTGQADDQEKYRIMDNPFLQPLRIPVRPSRLVTGALALIHAGALAGLSYAALPDWLQWLLAGCVVLSLVCSLQMHISPSADAPRELLLDSNGAWQVTDGNGQSRPAQLCRDALIHPALTALHLRTGRGQYRVLLTMDNADAETMRLLRVRLRHGHGA
jgi:hypothetical protein